MEPSLLSESAIGIPQAAQIPVVRATETLPESTLTRDVSRSRITASVPRTGEGTLRRR
jgi:hypothetical protein